MKNKTKLLSTLVVFLLCIVITLVLVFNEIYNYLIVVVPITLMAGYYFLSEFKNSSASDKELYEQEVNKVIRTYDGILVNTNQFPKLKNKSVLYVNKIEDLVDAQAEMRKPIYYVKRESSTAFFLLNDDIFLIYFIRLDKNALSGLEAEIKKLELESTIKFENFKDVDKTFILHTDDKSFKVSPIRDKEEPKEEVVEEKHEEVKEEQVIKEEEPVIEKEEIIETPIVKEEVINEQIDNTNVAKKKKKKKKKKNNQNVQNNQM